MTMRELLQQWAELEPERCQESGVSPGDFYVGDNTNFDNFDLIETENINHVAASGTLIMAVYLAIESKGWHYEQRWYGTIKVALVYPPGIKGLIRHEADTHAEALLRAYIEALLVTKRFHKAEVAR